MRRCDRKLNVPLAFQARRALAPGRHLVRLERYRSGDCGTYRYARNLPPVADQIAKQCHHVAQEKGSVRRPATLDK